MRLQDRDALLRFFTVAKRIALFLARASPQQTIDHLVYEISQQISEGDDSPAASESPTGVSLTYCMLEQGTYPLAVSMQSTRTA